MPVEDDGARNQSHHCSDPSPDARRTPKHQPGPDPDPRVARPGLRPSFFVHCPAPGCCPAASRGVWVCTNGLMSIFANLELDNWIQKIRAKSASAALYSGPET